MNDLVERVGALYVAQNATAAPLKTSRHYPETSTNSSNPPQKYADQNFPAFLSSCRSSYVVTAASAVDYLPTTRGNLRKSRIPGVSMPPDRFARCSRNESSSRAHLFDITSPGALNLGVNACNVSVFGTSGAPIFSGFILSASRAYSDAPGAYNSGAISTSASALEPVKRYFRYRRHSRPRSLGQFKYNRKLKLRSTTKRALRRPG